MPHNYSVFMRFFYLRETKINGFRNYSGETIQSRCAGRFAGMMLPINLDSDGAQNPRPV